MRPSCLPASPPSSRPARISTLCRHPPYCRRPPLPPISTNRPAPSPRRSHSPSASTTHRGPLHRILPPGPRLFTEETSPSSALWARRPRWRSARPPVERGEEQVTPPAPLWSSSGRLCQHCVARAAHPPGPASRASVELLRATPPLGAGLKPGRRGACIRTIEDHTGHLEGPGRPTC